MVSGDKSQLLLNFSLKSPLQGTHSSTDFERHSFFFLYLLHHILLLEMSSLKPVFLVLKL